MSPLKKVEPLEPIPPFFFEDYWALLKIAQLIGAFPYKKITKENGAVQLRSLNIVLSFLIHMVLCVMPYFLLVSPLIYEGTYEILLKNEAKITEAVSVTSSVVYQFVWNPMFLIFSNLILWKTYIMRADEATLTLSG